MSVATVPWWASRFSCLGRAEAPGMYRSVVWGHAPVCEPRDLVNHGVLKGSLASAHIWILIWALAWPLPPWSSAGVRLATQSAEGNETVRDS